jgi:transposase
MEMVTLGADSHKATHTLVAVDGAARQLGCRTFAANTGGHLEALAWP